VSADGAPHGYWDAHTHLSAGAADLHELDLRGAGTPDAVTAAVALAARSAPKGRFIRGWGWDGSAPLRDAAVDNPVFLARRDGHAAWVNPAARAALGLDPDAPVVDEEVFDAARGRLPALSTEERMSTLRPRLSELSALRVAAVDDMVESWGPEVYALLEDRGELPVSAGLWLPEAISENDAEALRRAFPESGRALTVAGIKILLDGSLGARTAALSVPYADDPGNAGRLRIARHDILGRVLRWAERGWPVALHAIGDDAVSCALDALERAPRPRWGAHRIEHAQVVKRTDLPRFAPAGVVVSLQPGHWRDDLPFVHSRLGDRRDVAVHPLRSLARHGTRVVLGSDWPVSSWDPGTVLAAAADPARGEEALDAATASAWYTSGPR
jgi:predicted amidohydrolase YtcJ